MGGQAPSPGCLRVRGSLRIPGRGCWDGGGSSPQGQQASRHSGCFQSSNDTETTPPPPQCQGSGRGARRAGRGPQLAARPGWATPAWLGDASTHSVGGEHVAPGTRAVGSCPGPWRTPPPPRPAGRRDTSVTWGAREPALGRWFRGWRAHLLGNSLHRSKFTRKSKPPRLIL